MRLAWWIAGMMFIGTTAASAQLNTRADSTAAADALAAYIVTAPAPIGGHGPMVHLVVDTTRSPWNRIFGPAARSASPVLWLGQGDAAAPYAARIDIRTARIAGDTVTVSAVWTWCYSDAGGESVAPIDYAIVRSPQRWTVASASTSMIGHGRQCSFGRTGAR